MRSDSLLKAPPEDRTKYGIVAVDPGHECGIATYHPYPAVPGRNFDTESIILGVDGHEHLHDILRDKFFSYRDFMRDATQPGGPSNVLCIDEIIILVERFEYRKDDVRKREAIDYTAAEYVGVAKLVGAQRYDMTVFQGAAEAKAFWTNDKIRELGLDTRGRSNDEVDALRHLLRYMTFKLNQSWLLMALKPEGRPILTRKKKDSTV